MRWLPAGRAGFTLLELLVVMVLVGLTMTTVTPRLYHSLDNYRADAEERALLELTERAAYRAFFRQREVTLHFSDRMVLTPAQEEVVSFAFLAFPEQVVSWNHNGFSAAMGINYTIQGRERTLTFRPEAESGS